MSKYIIREKRAVVLNNKNGFTFEVWREENNRNFYECTCSIITSAKHVSDDKCLAEFFRERG